VRVRSAAFNLRPGSFAGSVKRVSESGERALLLFEGVAPVFQPFEGAGVVAHVSTAGADGLTSRGLIGFAVSTYFGSGLQGVRHRLATSLRGWSSSSFG
jgi:hypothetical protein